MKRIDFHPTSGTTRSQVLTRKKLDLLHTGILAVAMLVVIALFASAASAGDFAFCDKVKHGKSGQCYAWKKDC